MELKPELFWDIFIALSNNILVLHKKYLLQFSKYLWTNMAWIYFISFAINTALIEFLTIKVAGPVDVIYVFT